MTTGNSLWGDNGRQAKVLKKFVAWITIAAFLGQPTLAAAQAVAEPNAPAQHRPTVEAAQNGVPVVQITAPSAAGVSRNLYQALSVEQMGLILNNSRLVTQTQLGGYITGNPNLAGGSARVILNQVTGTGASNLRGFIEVAGQRAEVIIANPNGIAVSGGGFINTSRAVLTTGTPIFGGSGSLEAFRITGGQITVEGSGLDASTTDRVDLLSRAVQVNAGVWAKELNIVTGANEVNNIDLSTQRIAGTEAAPAVSLDVAALGGMYANKIKLVGTEAGVGVNSRGTIAAAGDLTLTQEGKIVLAGSTSAAGNIVAATGSDFTNQGTLYAQGNTNISAAGALTNTGVLAAAQNTAVAAQSINATGALAAGLKSDGTVGTAGDLTLTASGAIIAKGQNLAGGNLAMNGATVDLSGATTYAGGNAAVTATAGGVDNTGGNLQAGGALNISAAGTVKNDITGATAGQISAGKLTINAGDISNKGGQITQTGSSNTNITAAGAIDNTGGTIATNGDSLTVQAGSVTNSQGQIQQAGAGTLTVNSTGDLRNDGGNVATNGQLNIGAGNINNAQGSLMAQKQVAVSAVALTNDNGIIASGTASINIKATGALSNRQGTLQGQKGLDITAQSFDNQGGRAINLDTSKTIVTTSQGIQNQSGEIGGNGDVLIAAKSLNNAGGKVTAQNDIILSTPDGINNTGGTLSAGQNLTINQSAANLANSQGNISAIGNLTLRAATVDNSGGKLAANADASIRVNGLSGLGEIRADQDLSLTVNGDYTNSAGNLLKANRDFTFTVGGLFSNAGTLEAGRNLTISGSSLVNGASGLLAANGTLNANVSGDFTNYGSVFGNDIALQANRIFNTNATAVIAGTGNMKLFAATSLENKDDATIYSFGNIDIAANAAKDGSGNYLNKTNTVLNQSATIEARGNIDINANTLTNRMRSYNVVTQLVSSASYDQYGVHVSNVDPNLYAIIPDLCLNGYTYNDNTSAVQLTTPSTMYNDKCEPILWLLGETVTETTATATSPAARLVAGRDMKISANTITNENSMLLAAGTLTTTPGATINNIASGSQRVSTRRLLYGNSRWRVSGTSEMDTNYYGWGPHFTEQAPAQFPTLSSTNDFYLGPVYYDTVTTSLGGLSAVIGGGSAVNIQGKTVNNVVVAPGSVTSAPQTSSGSAQAGAVSRPQTTGSVNITLPTNGMFAINTAPTAKYLVETNSRFTSYQNFISSDYMLKQLNYDPSKTEKRLGDGFYEQQLVRDQVTQLTGRTYLSTFGNTEDQYKALLNSGAVYAQQMNLTVGVALTAEQMANLTTDIVWLVEQEVQGQKVLVPVVYLAKVRSGDLTAAGAVIAADNVQIAASGDLTNIGVIKATDKVDVTAANVANKGGVIEAGNIVNITTVQDLTNTSGIIKGDQVQLVAGGNVKVETASTTTTLPFLTRTTVSDTATVSAGKNLTIQADGNVSLVGAKLSAGQDVSVNAGGNLTTDSVKAQERLAVGYYLKDEVTNTLTSIESGGNTNLTAKGDMTLKGTQVTAGNELSVTAGGNITATAVKDTATSDVTTSSGGTVTRIMTNDEWAIGTSLTAKNNVTVKSSGESVTLEGSQVVSEAGKATVTAAKAVTIKEVTEKHEVLKESRETSSGFLSSKVTETRDYTMTNAVIGSTVSGDTVKVNADKDLTVRGSSVVGTGDVDLTAKGNVSIVSAQELGQDEHYKFEKVSGIFGGGGLGFTIGSQSKKETLDGQTVTQVGSSVGSLNGSVNITANQDVKVTGSSIVSGNDTNIKGQNVTVEAATNSSQSKYAYEFKQSGLTVSLSGGAASAVTNLASDVRRIGNVSDERLKALYAYKGYKELKELGNYAGDLTKDVSINVSLGSTRYSTETVTMSTSVQESIVIAGGNVNITATGSGAKDAAGRAADGDVNIAGSTVSGWNVILDAVKDVNLTATENTIASTTGTSSSSSGVGVSMGAKKGVFVEGNKSSLNANETGNTHTQTVVAADNALRIKSGSDTNIVGSQAKGDTVKMTVDGNLNIASLQDTENYSERSSSSGGSIGLGTDMASKLSASRGKIDSNYTSVTEQSGVYAGQGGFNINVGGNTDLKGAVIASDATPDKNKLTTDTLTWSDIQNKAEYKASRMGVNAGWGKGTEKKDQGITPAIGSTASGKADSTTKAAVSPGTIEVRSNPNIDLSGLSRDPAGALNALGKIFDKKSVAEQQELAQVFGEVAFKAIGDLGLKEGSPEKAALEAFAGGLMAKFGGGSFISGAAGAGFTQLLMNELKNITDPAALQWAIAIVGAVAASLVGGDAQTGASVAISEVRNNRLSHIVTDTAKVAEGLNKGLKDKGIETVEAFQTILEHPVETVKGIVSTLAEIWNDSSLVAKIGRETLQDYQNRLDALVNGSAFETGEQLGYLSVDLGLLLLDVGVASKLVEKVPSLARAVEVLNNERGSLRLFNVQKQESSVWKSLDNVRGTDRKTSGFGSNKRYYEWDNTHNDIEVYNSRGKHLGSMNPTTGEFYKPAVEGRRIEI